MITHDYVISHTKKFEKHTIGITWKYPQGYQKKRP